MEEAISCSPCLVVLRHVDALGHVVTAGDGKEGSFSPFSVATGTIFTACIPGPSILQTLQQCIDDANKTQGQQCILLGLVEQGKIPEGIAFSNEIEIKVGVNFDIVCFLILNVQAPSEEERYYLLSEQMDTQGGLLASDVSLAALAKQSAAMVALDLADLVKKSLCAVIK